MQIPLRNYWLYGLPIRTLKYLAGFKNRKIDIYIPMRRSLAEALLFYE